MPRAPVTHKVKASECGAAHRGDGLSANWADVDCPGCIARRPSTPAPVCRHCQKPVNGRCVRVSLESGWLHDTCLDPFEASPEGRALRRTGGDPYLHAKCPRCGRPGIHPDGRTCPDPQRPR